MSIWHVEQHAGCGGLTVSTWMDAIAHSPCSLSLSGSGSLVHVSQTVRACDVKRSLQQLVAQGRGGRAGGKGVEREGPGGGVDDGGACALPMRVRKPSRPHQHAHAAWSPRTLRHPLDHRTRWAAETLARAVKAAASAAGVKTDATRVALAEVRGASA